MSIPNWGAMLPKEYQDKGHGMNELTGLPKLFRGILLGSSGSGKTNLLIDFIKRSPNVYTHLHLIARQPNQPLYEYLADKLGGFVTIYDESTVPRVDDIKKNGLQLVVFDDFSNDQKWTAEHVTPFYIRGRHRGLTTLFLAHAFHSGCPKMVRLNNEVLMLLKSPSKTDLKSVLRDMPIANVTDDDLWQYYSQVSKDRGQMLLINTLDQTIRYNWKQILHDGMAKKD
jgi:hypothetical protein